MQTRRSQLVSLSVVAVAALVLSGCGSLSKSQARAILLADDAGDFQKSVYIDLGFLSARCGQPPTTGKYALLHQAGILQVRPGGTTEVVTTDKGDDVFKRIGAERMNVQDFKLVTGQQTCNFRSWVVPIATRELLDVTVNPNNDGSAEVIYKWRWKPNELGESFMASSNLYRSLPRRLQDSLTEQDEEHELPLDNSILHATEVKFARDSSGEWHVAR